MAAERGNAIAPENIRNGTRNIGEGGHFLRSRCGLRRETTSAKIVLTHREK